MVTKRYKVEGKDFKVYATLKSLTEEDAAAAKFHAESYFQWNLHEVKEEVTPMH